MNVSTKSVLLFLIAGLSAGCQYQSSQTTVVSESVADSDRVPEKITVDVSPTPARISAVNQKVVEQIKRIVGKIVGLDAKAIDVNAPLSMQKIAADELDVVEIILEVEDHFKIEIKDKEIGGGTDISQLPNLSVNHIAEVVVQKQKSKSGIRK